MSVSAQFRAGIDDDQNGTRFEDPDYSEAQIKLDETRTQDDLSEIETYLRQREAARKQRQARRETRSAIGLNRQRVDLNRRLNRRKCRDLRRWGLKCY